MRTEAQEKAQARAWRIRQLRMLYSQAWCLDPARAFMLQDMIEKQLTELGAKTEAQRREEYYASLD